MAETRRGRAALLAATVGATLLLLAAPVGAQAAFGIGSFDGEALDSTGHAYTQAGGHPFAATTKIDFNTTFNGEGETVPDESVRRIEVELPPGFVGNPLATPTRCTEAQLTGGPPSSIGTCPDTSQVGVAHLVLPEGFFENTTVPVYNMVPAADEPAQLGIRYLTTDIHITAALRSDSDYGINATLREVSNAIPLLGATLTLWGVPADHRHDSKRGACLASSSPADACSTDAPSKAFWTLPTACMPTETGLETRVRAESWPGSTDSASFVTHLPPGAPEPGPEQGPTGCDRVPFHPTFAVQPTTNSAASPSGLAVDLTVPQQGLTSGPGTASSALREAVLTLPAGITVNASSAAGLAACSPAQIGLLGSGFGAPNPIRFDAGPASCPDAAKLGTVEIETPSLEDPLRGAVYLAQQGTNPFGGLIAIYLVAAGDGVIVKLPGRITTDPGSGQVTATFSDIPQLPFEHLRVNFFGGSRAALTTPEACGSYPVSAHLAPWSGTAPVDVRSEVKISSGPGGGACPGGDLDPHLVGGSVNPLAAVFSPFSLDLSREDGTQRLGSMHVTLPKGLLGDLTGIPYCPDSVLAAIATGKGAGAAEAAAPSCPAASGIGDVKVSAGSGASPFYIRTGHAYLAGPYHKATLSLAVVLPALAGPFDLGNVVVRTALRVDPETARITANVGSLPRTLAGIKLDLRDIRVRLNRSRFTLNPSSCEPLRVRSGVGMVGGVVVHPSDRYQASDCERLGFQPSLSLQMQGAMGPGGHPRLIATLRPRKGDSNIAQASVALPHAAALDQAHIGTICAVTQYEAGECPKQSIYGYAEARSPLIEEPLKGPIYLRADDEARELPDLVAALRGQVDIDLVGHIDTFQSGFRESFQRVPDAPLTSLTLKMNGGSSGLLVNSENLCASPHQAVVRMAGQNGRVHDFNPLLRPSCSTRR
jgi:hypothetical protein